MFKLLKQYRIKVQLSPKRQQLAACFSIQTNKLYRNIEILDAKGGLKPFSAIPGPAGLPYLGTLFQYTNGKYQ